MSKKNLYLFFALMLSVMTAQTQAPNCYLTLTGNPQTVNIPHNVALSPISTSLTAEFNIKRNSDFSGSPQSQIVLHKKDPANYNDNQLGYSIIILQSGDAFGAYKPLAILGDGTNYEDFYPTNASDNTVLGVWSHWAFVYNALTHTGQWYKDGAGVPTTKVSNANVAGILSTYDLNIGGAAIPSFPNVYLNADLDEVRLWNIARTATEIDNNKNNSLAGTETGLFAYYNFDDNTANGSGQTVPNKATVTGATINGTTTGGASTPSFSCAPKIWNGGSTMWNNAANWTPSGIPTATDDVIIPDLPNDPAMSFIPGSVKDLTIADGVTIGVNSGIALYINGNISAGSGSGSTIAGAGGVVELNSSDAQQINGKFTVKTLRINNSSMGGVDVLGTLNITNGLIMIDGDVNANSGTVTLKSDASATAFLDNFSNVTAGTYFGDLTVERYMANTADGYRDISSPVNTTVLDLADDISIFGQDGVDCWYSYSPYPNVQVYNEAHGNALSTPSGNFFTGWISKTGTGNAMPAMKGFAIRTYTGAPYTIDLTGPPYTGSKSADLFNTASSTPSQDGWNFIGNPFPSPISWNSTEANNPGATTGSYYVYNTTGEYTGNWGSWNGTTGANGATDNIGIMQGFFVKTLDTYNYVEANSTSRVASATAPFFKSYTTQPNEIRLQLSGNNNTDEIVAYTDGNATWSEDNGLDAIKIPAGSTVYMSYKQLGKEYAINVIDEVTETTELPLVIWVTDTGTYNFEATELNVSGFTVYLKDAEQNTLTDLNTNSPTLQLNGQQIYEGRYSIVFETVGQPSGIANINNSGIKIYSHNSIAVVERASDNPAIITISNTLGQTIREVTTDSRRTEIVLDNSSPWYAIVKVKESNVAKSGKVLIK